VLSESLVQTFGDRSQCVDRNRAFASKAEGDFTLFWSAGNGFGQLIRRGKELTLSVLGGSLDIGEIVVAGLGAHQLGKRRAIATGGAAGLAVRAGTADGSVMANSGMSGRASSRSK
jgi:non-lysosomal glucosylceramidase